jgi:UDP-glucose 4-epimerase
LENLLEFIKALKNLMNVLNQILLVQMQFLSFVLENNIKLIYSATSASLGNNGNDKNLSPYAFTKSKNLELLENLRKWFNFKFEVIYFYNVYGPGQIKVGDMATVVGIFEDQYEKNKPLTYCKTWNPNKKVYSY